MTTSVQSKLIRHDGKVVPWVARWSDEVVQSTVQVSLRDRELWVSYKDGNESREASGILWVREGIKRGGEPQFAQVSTYRQRSAMARRLCQVCGQATTEEPMRWLVPRVLLLDRGGETVTASAPTCELCIKISLGLCPHLKLGDWVIGRVLEYQAWGVLGEGVYLKDGKVGRLPNLSYRYGMKHPLIAPTAMIAKQQLVVWNKFTLESAADYAVAQNLGHL
jgi:hypothetical protein